MKKILYTAIILLVGCFTAKALERQSAGIVIDNLRTEITGDRFDVNFTLKASGLWLKCDGRHTLEFAVENDDRRLVLPSVIYSGTHRYRYEQRRALLSNDYHPEPYHIYKGVKKSRVYDLDYTVSIPYYTWMEHASVILREYTHDCSGEMLISESVLVADLNPATVIVEPEIWRPNSALFPNLVSFLVPEVEEVKARASLIELNIGFPVNVTEVRPAFGDNRRELALADSLIYAVDNNELLSVNCIGIRGYASPEGTYAANERLAKGRSRNFHKYLSGKYPDNQYVRNAQISWVAEDWDGLEKMVMESELSEKEDVLAVIRTTDMAPDNKERALQDIFRWSDNYKRLLKEMYPALRRIELRVDYTVQKLDDNKARELLYTQPGLLSLEEIYRVARFYEPGTKQYREVYEIAAKQFPNDVVANNNAAAALLLEGNAEAALPFLEKIEGTEESYINYGAYHYISGDLDTATEYFDKAKEAGNPQAEHNLNLVTDERSAGRASENAMPGKEEEKDSPLESLTPIQLR